MSTFLLIVTWASGLSVLFVRPSWLPEKWRKPYTWTRGQLAALLLLP
jgi:hypothetical protein